MKHRVFVAAVTAVLFSVAGSVTAQPVAPRSSESKGTPEARKFVAEGDTLKKPDAAADAARKAADRLKAIAAYRRAIEADPHYVEAHSK